ncbi:MAG TPA: hypothetical protein H9943_04175 [Candidatus Ruthenibacterium avium]|uniref:Uncharacterized protein n=1 Tax=Candidatus Ruthenibacterium avium TaxID=2838751 RepID=A0A9D2S193_9FIRM|nr:hypothetical protein [Candidatus Ruthenibacterium avium]
MKHIFTALCCAVLAAGVFAAPCFNAAYGSPLTAASVQEASETPEDSGSQSTYIFPPNNEAA